MIPERNVTFPGGLGFGGPAAGDDDFDPTVARVVRGNPTDEELAAVMAVIAAVFDAGSTADRPRDLARRRTGWQRTQRALRGDSPGDQFGMRFGR